MCFKQDFHKEINQEPIINIDISVDLQYIVDKNIVTWIVCNVKRASQVVQWIELKVFISIFVTRKTLVH